MNHLMKVFFLMAVHFVANTEHFVIRTKNSNTKRVIKDTNYDQFAVASQNAPKSANWERKDSESSIENNSDSDLHTEPHYRFSYKVFDPNTGDDKEHEEKRDGELVQGQYSLVEPDGSRRIVTYISNGTDGFNAVVTKIKPLSNAQPLGNINLEQETSSPQIQENQFTQVESSQGQNLNNENSEKEIQPLNGQNGQENVALNEENSNDQSNVQSAPFESDEPVIWFSSKTEYIPTNLPEEQKSNEQQLIAEASQRHTVSKLPKAVTNPHFIRYFTAIPQNLYTTNDNKNNDKKNIVANSNKSKKTNSNRNVQIINDSESSKTNNLNESKKVQELNKANKINKDSKVKSRNVRN